MIAEFPYRIERIWERPIDYWLKCGSGLAPLALLTDEANSAMESSLDRLGESLSKRGVDERTFKSLMSSTYVLCGLRHNNERIEPFYGGSAC